MTIEIMREQHERNLADRAFVLGYFGVMALANANHAGGGIVLRPFIEQCVREAQDDRTDKQLRRRVP